jgi:hypothetical protein
VDKVFAVLIEVIPSMLRVVDKFGEDGGLRLARLRPNDGPTAVLVVALLKRRPIAQSDLVCPRLELVHLC